MSKRPSKRNTELERLHEQYASWVVSHRLSDGSSRQWSQKHRFFDISVHSKPLIEWLDEIDRTLDPKVLLPLLNIPPEARPYFEALFEGLDFKHNHKSRRRRFQPTEHQQKLLAALFEREEEPAVRANTSRGHRGMGKNMGRIKERIGKGC